MDLFAGTSKGVFQITDGIAKKVLDCGGVREIVCFNGRIFVGTGNGLYVSDDGGASWLLTTLRDVAVWQIRQGAQGKLYAGTAPTGLFRSEDWGYTWKEVLDVEHS